MEAGGPKPTEKQTIHPRLFFFNSLDILNSEVEICGYLFLGKNNLMVIQNGLTISHTYTRCSLKLY